ncbi:aminoglycoside phosphotransferase family protein [Streptomyces sp. AJS327]|uniref:aminoglycoside phosphotransferase family protein n=1 Tax=Streptomyces sp. AJS327 TaxID=2545265 RepID=UPI0015E04A8E|nr:aminoglycoside phosphotransferase family protein [Streptomyces sp. AJS327]MBA0054332.1 aminoglycoside phosphotransferase family protein [Streptomyces sp. AJS327]
MQRLTNNPSSAVYRITTAEPSTRSLIIKLYRGRACWRAKREDEALQHLGSLPTTFSVPAVAGRVAVPGTDIIALVTEDMGEHHLHHAVQKGQVPRMTALNNAGELLTAFHQLPLYESAVAAPPLAQRLTSLAARLPESMRLATADAFVEAISLVAGRPAVLCHGDLHLHNIVTHRLHDSHGLAVIDFEEIGLAVPEWDLAQTAVTTDACANADLEQLLAAYAHPVDTALLAHLTTVQCVRGWYYACRGEGRDEALWRRRLSLSFSTAHASAPLEGHT